MKTKLKTDQQYNQISQSDEGRTVEREIDCLAE